MSKQLKLQFLVAVSILLSLLVFVGCKPAPRKSNFKEKDSKNKSISLDKEQKIAIVRDRLLKSNNYKKPTIKFEDALVKLYNSTEDEVTYSKCPYLEDYKLEDLKMKIQCGGVKVPQNHIGQVDKYLSLGFTFISKDEGNASEKQLLIIEQGGPGGSSIELAMIFAIRVPDLLKNFHILAVEQRGFEGSYPNAICKEGEQFFLENPDLLDDQSQSVKILKQCETQIANVLDIDFISTYQIASDIAYVASGFGYDKFLFYGVSYGGLVGQYLLNYYPDHVLKAVLDSTVSPNVLWKQYAFDNFSQKVNDKINSILNSHSSWNFTVDNFKEYFLDLFDQFIDLNLSFEINHNGITKKVSISKSLFNNLINKNFNYTSVKELVNFLKLFEDLDNQADMIKNKIKEMFIYEFENSFLKRAIPYQSIICREIEQRLIIPSDVHKIKSFEGQIPVNILSDDIEEYALWSSNKDHCNLNYSFKSNDEKILYDSVKTNTPVFLLSGSLDTVTPKELIEKIQVNMPNAFNIVISGAIHGVFGSQECVNKSVLKFLSNEQLTDLNECQ